MVADGNVELAAESLHIGDNPLSQLGLAGRSRRIRRQAWEQADELLDLVGLTEGADRPAGLLSTGQGRLGPGIAWSTQAACTCLRVTPAAASRSSTTSQ